MKYARAQSGFRRNSCRPPTASITADETTVDGGDDVSLTVTGERIQSYEWSATGGTFGTVASNGAVTWTAPSPRAETSYTLTVTVRGRDGQTATANVTITVNATANENPTVTLTASKSRVSVGETITLTAAATDDGEVVSYAWSPASIKNTSTPGSASWTAPATDTEATHTLSVTVTDDDGATASASTTITVEPSNTAPTVTVEASSTAIEGGESVTLTGTATDDDGTIEFYSWSAGGSAGEFTDRNRPQTVWKAPRPVTDATYTITFAAIDDDGAIGSATVTIAVKGPNEAPAVTSVTAAESTIESGGKVKLTAVASDDDGTIESYAWSGQGRFENTETAGVVNWRAPSPKNETEYTLTVTVTDDDGATADGTVAVTVEAAPPAEPEPEPEPIVSFEGPHQVDEGQTVTVNVTIDERAPSGATVRYTFGNADERARHERGEGTGDCRDYEYKTGTLNLAGKTSAVLTLRTLADTCVDESREFVQVSFDDPVKVDLDVDSVYVRIENKHSEIQIAEVAEERSVREGGSITISLERNLDEPGQRVRASVDVHLAPVGGATAGDDYVVPDPSPQTISFSAGQSRRTVTFRALHDDEYHEAGEGFQVVLSNPAGAKLGTRSSAAVMIDDPDDGTIRISLEASATSVTEGGTVRCTVSVEEAKGRSLDRGLRVRFDTLRDNQGAVDGTDFTAKEEWLTFGRGARQQRTVEFETFRTQENRGDRAFQCRIGADATISTDYDYSGKYALEIGNHHENITIKHVNVNDTDPEATDRGPVWAYDQTVGERSLQFALNLNGELPDALNGNGKAALRVRWTTSAGDNATATSSDENATEHDYRSASGTYTFQPGGATSTQVYIQIRCDSIDEDVEHFYVTATGERLNGTRVGGTSTVKITIGPEDGRCGGGRRVLSIADASATEGGRMEFTVSRPAEEGQKRLFFDYETKDGTARAGEDYEATSGTLDIWSNENTRTLTVQILSDDVRDEGETFEVVLSNVRTSAGVPRGFADNVGVGTIIDSDAIGTEFRNVPESHTSDEFTMQLHVTAPLDATDAEVAAAITVEGADVAAAEQSELVWRLTVTPTTAGNLVIGLDHETLEGEAGRSVAPLAPVTVYGRSVASIADAEAKESDGTIRFTVSLDAPTRETATVDWRTADGTATNGRDYEAASGTLRFEPGETEAFARVSIFPTTEAEPDETFTVTIEKRSGPIVIDTARSTATGTIKDNSVGVEFDQPASPRTDDSNFTVPLRFRPSSFEADAADVLAALRVKHRGYRGECALEEGEVDVVGVTPATGTSNSFEAEINPGGTCHIELVIARESTFGDAVMQYDAQIWIMGPRSVSAWIGDTSASEADTHMRFTVEFDAPPVETVTIDYATEDGTATAGSDYTATSGTITLDPPERRRDRPSAVIEVPLRNDSLVEETETLTVRLSNPSAGVNVRRSTATGEIETDDQGASFYRYSPRTDGEFEVEVNFVLPIGKSAEDERNVKNALRVSAGTITRVWAYGTGGTTFRMSINPPDDRDIEVVLPRGSRIGSHTVLNEARIWMYGPVGMAISDAEQTEGPDRSIEFPVRMSRTASVAVSVNYATRNGTATAGSDYTSTAGTLTFAAGETLKHISVPILDDDVDEADEQFAVKLTRPPTSTAYIQFSDDEAIGTIKNHDALPIALVARFGRATASHIVDQVETRIEQPAKGTRFDVNPGMGHNPGPHGGPHGLQPAGHGRHARAELLGAEPDSVRRKTLEALGARSTAQPVDDDPLAGTSLAMSRHAGGGTFALWSQSAQTSFTGQQGAISLGGNVHSRMIGADYARGRLLTGVAVGHSRAGGNYSGVSSGEVTTSLTGLYPWIGYRATDSLTVWAVAGRAGGSMLLTRPEAGATRTTTSMTMVAGGGRSRIGRTRAMDLAVKADVLWVGTAIEGVVTSSGRLSGASAAVTRIRSGIEGARTYSWGRFAMRPSIEMAFRRDGGDAETGAGLDAGAGIDVSDTTSGFGATIHVRRLLFHQAEGFEEHGLSVAMTYDPSPATPVGLRAEVTPSWGAQATGGARALWSRDSLGGANGRGRPYGRSLDGRIGYGLRHGNRFVGTPRIGVRSSDYGRSWLVGYALELLERGGMNLQLDIDAERRENPRAAGADNGIVGRATVGWN